MDDLDNDIGDTEPGEPEGRRRQIVRPWVVALTIALAVPAIYGMSMFLPEEALTEERPTPVSRSFNGNGPINVDAEGVAVKGYDVVAYFTENKPVKGSEAIEADYENGTFRFASDENRRRFLENPEKYVPAYGGYCSLGVANGYKDDMHPEAFSIIGGKLYFNLTPRIHDYWADHTEGFIAKADENWPDLRTAPGNGWGDGR